MAKKKVRAKVIATKAIILPEIQLSQRQNEVVTSITPEIYIKERQTRGGKKAKYVEGGYVIAKLNQAFSPIGWDFDVVEQGILDKEVWVKGRLVIKDMKSGYTFSKTQYGQHLRDDKVPLGDTLKAAATDALKKCASMIGIALDVYWQHLDVPETSVPPKMSSDELLQRAKGMILATRDTLGLIEYSKKLGNSLIYNEEQKKELRAIINKRVEELDNQSE